VQRTGGAWGKSNANFSHLFQSLKTLAFTPPARGRKRVRANDGVKVTDDYDLRLARAIKASKSCAGRRNNSANPKGFLPLQAL
jgi:hypothetical protein